MIHNAGVSIGVAGGILQPLIGKSILPFEMKRGKWLLIEKMAVPVLKCTIIVIVHLNRAVFDPKGILVVVANFVMVDFWCPAREIFAIENRPPLTGQFWGDDFLGLDFFGFTGWGAAGSSDSRKNKQGEGSFFHEIKTDCKTASYKKPISNQDSLLELHSSRCNHPIF